MSGDCHPVRQPIDVVRLDARMAYEVGVNGITRIEAVTKPGMHCDIPYIRVWAGDVAVIEACQHNLLAVEFACG